MDTPTHSELSAEGLTTLRFFRGESPDALDWLLDTSARRHLRAGDVLLQPGTANEELFVILAGTLEVRLDPAGEIISTLERGDCAGEMSVLDRTHTSAWVSAPQDCELMVLGAAQLWTLITHSHTVAVNLLCMLSERVRSDNRLIDHSQQLRSFYEYHAKVDALTGLYNRRWLDQSLVRLARRAELNDAPLGLIMSDLDHFKQYNDSHGHLAGDTALHSIATLITANLRPHDLAARYGGEEMVVLLPDTTLEQAMVIAARLCDAVRSARLHNEDGRPLPGVTVSLGVAAESGAVSPGRLLAAADAALYRAKTQGRDRVSL